MIEERPPPVARAAVSSRTPAALRSLAPAPTATLRPDEPRPSVLVLREEWRRVSAAIGELCKDETVQGQHRIDLLHQMVRELDIGKALEQLGGREAFAGIFT